MERPPGSSLPSRILWRALQTPGFPWSLEVRPSPAPTRFIGSRRAALGAGSGRGLGARGRCPARVLPGLPSARHCVGAEGELSEPGVGEVGRLLLGFVNAHPGRALTPFPEGEFPRKCSANR